MAPKICIAAITEAMETEAKEHLKEVDQAAEDTTMEDNPNLQVIIRPTTKINPHAGTVLFRGIVKKTAANASRTENLALDSMDPPTGQDQNNLQSTRNKKGRENRMSREQLERCIQVNWLVFFRVFSKGCS